MCPDVINVVLRQVDPQRHDDRFYHPKRNSEITKFMDAFWRQKEQENLQQ